MYTSLRIVKKLAYAWMYYPDGSLTGFSISKGYITGDEFTGLLQIVEQGKTKRPAVDIFNVTVKDEFSNGIEVGFNSFVDLFEYLVTLGNPLMQSVNVQPISSIPGLEATLNDIKDRLLDIELPDMVISSVTPTLTGNALSVAALDFTWRIARNMYFNKAIFSTTIATTTVAALGEPEYNRIDILVGNTWGLIEKVQGTESLGVAVKPSTPVNMVELALISVSGSTIYEPTKIVTTDSVLKDEFAFTKLTGSGAKAQFSIFSEATNVKVISASSIASISIQDKKYIYSGKDHYVKNETGTTLMIQHNSGTGNYKYFFPNATNLVIQNNQIVHFKFRFDTGNNGFLDYVGGVTTLIPYNIFKFIQKGFGNVNLTLNEVGDIFSGWKNDGTVRYSEAKWIGGALNNSDNFIPLVQTEI